jgi:integrase
VSLTHGTTIAKTARKIDHIFLRPNSKYWRVRVQRNGKSVEKSLGTTDRAIAEELARPIIGEHKLQLLIARVPEGVTFRHDYEPGREHPGPEGGKIIATTTELIYLDKEGRITIRGPNGLGGLGFALPSPNERPAYGDKSDDGLFDTYLADSGLTGYPKKEAEAMWRLFKTVVGKPLAKCDRNDGKALVKHLEDEADEPLKSATLRRKMVPLIATVNLAIKDSKHVGVNPFVGCVPDRDDEEERDAFTDDDMKIIRANLDKLDANDQLLLRIVATTGMDRGEAFSIAGERIEDGIRYCEVGTKTAHRLRRIPFPKDLLPYLPKKITGPLLAGRKDGASKRLRKFLEDIGIINDRDGRNLAPNHSFRHRAKNRLRRAVPDVELRDTIGGWTTGKKNSGRKYGNKHGAGYPISVLRKAIDKIGF